MNKYLPGLAAISLLTATSQALALEVEVHRAGMLFTNIPLTTKFMRSNETASGIRIGQTRFSTDKYGSLLNAFTHHPAMLELQFRPAGQNESERL